MNSSKNKDKQPDTEKSSAEDRLSRRHFLTTAIASVLTLPALVSEAGAELRNQGKRNALGKRKRKRDIALAFKRRRVRHRRNHDENKAFQYFASFSKALPKNELGEVSRDVYRTLLQALSSGDFTKLRRVNIGIQRLANPEASLAYGLQGKDSAQFTMPPAPSFSSAENAAEIGELYWMALARDVHFSDYESTPLIQRALNDMAGYIDFKGPITVDQAFRGRLPGCAAGPYLSQFLLKDFQCGSLSISNRQRTVPAGYDQMTDFDDWLLIQNGQIFKVNDPYDPVARYIRNGRDLAEYVHNDQIIQAYFNSVVSLLDLDLPPFDEGNPLFSQSGTAPFTTFGSGHVIGLLGEVSRLALQAAWFQKWQVHRRMRPEEFGGRLDRMLRGLASYPIHENLLNSAVLQETWDTFGSYLLPQAYTEGCPTHPAYPAGHAVVAGALVTILKAFFNEAFPMRDPVVASADGTSLEPYTGPDAGQLTLGGELNKLAANIALGRNFAGIHYRTDATGGFVLGEQVALGLLRSQLHLYEEGYAFTLTRFNGKTVRVRSRGIS